jgi:rubrerythrin
MGNLADIRILDTCRKVEEAAARLYHLLAKLHRDNAGMAALWTKTAREEENHATQIEMLRRRKMQMASSVKVDPTKAEKALELVEAVIVDAMLNSIPVRRALEEAVTLENVLVQFHTDYAVEFADEADQKLFRSMMAADRDHVGALSAALDALGRARP